MHRNPRLSCHVQEQCMGCAIVAVLTAVCAAQPPTARPPAGKPAAGLIGPAQRPAKIGAARAQVYFHSTECQQQELRPQFALEYRSDAQPENLQATEALGDQRWRTTSVLNGENCRDHSLISNMPAWSWEGALWIGMLGPPTPVRTTQALCLVRVELKGIPLPPKAVVEKATLRLLLRTGFPGNSIGKEDRATIGVYRVRTAWPAPLCWKSHPEVDAEPFITASFDGSEGWKDLDITPMVKKWLSGDWENHGLCMGLVSVERREPAHIPDAVPARLQNENNVLWNGDAEENENGMPVGWRSNGDATVDAVAHSGKQGLKVAKAGSWRQVLRDIPPGKRLILSALARTQGIAEDTVAGACIQVFDVNGEVNDEGFARTTDRFPLKGDTDWTQIRCSAVAPRDTVAVQVVLFLVPKGGEGQGVGAVWFDDMKLEVEDAPLKLQTRRERDTITVTLRNRGKETERVKVSYQLFRGDAAEAILSGAAGPDEWTVRPGEVVESLIPAKGARETGAYTLRVTAITDGGEIVVEATEFQVKG